MTVHELKIEPQWFERVISGEKTVEIRKDDRDFQAGDRLRLREFDRSKTYGQTAREITVDVLHVLRHEGLVEGYVALSIRLVTS